MQIQQRVVRLLYPHGSQRTVLRGPARGMRFAVAPGMGLTYALGFEDAAPRYLARFAHPGMTVYDVGANRGQMALILSRLVGPAGRVVAFEPAAEPFEALRQNVAALSNVTARRLALSDAQGEATFAYNARSSTQGRLADTTYFDPYVRGGAQTFTVETATVDDCVAKHSEPPPDFLKIDVEGAGALVLRGAARALETVAPGVFIEIHNEEEKAGVRDELCSRGYVVETLDGERIADPTQAHRAAFWCYRP